jgi:hypothetical protein
MFVLATMMLLMVLGVSVIAAAGYNVGAGIAQANRTQLELYSSSMERTIKAAFVDVDEEQDKGEPLTAATTLGGQILREAISESGIFDNSLVDGVEPGSRTVVIVDITTINPGDFPADAIFIDPITITMTTADLPGDVNVEEYTIIITGQLNVFVNPYERRPPEYVFTGGTPEYQEVIYPATPLTMTITGDLVVNLLTEFAPIGNMNQEMPVPYTFESETTYRLDQLILTEGPIPSILFPITKTPEPELADMLINSDVVWTVINFVSFS